ncbi:MAG: hypothetical protein AB1649_02925 [Chloroflexota bacterium]
MVREEKALNFAVARYRLGGLLIWLGVLVWAPFIFLRVIGEEPAFLWFLPFHLIGVIGGSRLRAIARKELDIVLPKKNTLHKIGHGLIFLGILVWVPYFYLKLVAGQPVEVLNFLPYHLAGVLGGVFVHLVSYLKNRSLAEA